MTERKEQIFAKNVVGGREVVQNSSFVQSVIHKTRRAVSKASLFLGLLAATPSFAACALPPEEACNVVEPEARPLDRFFGEFDIRDVEPLAEGERSQLKMLKLRAVDLPPILGARFSGITGLDVDINTLFQYSENEIDGVGVSNRILLNEDTGPFLAQLKTLDGEASVQLLDKENVQFQVNGQEYKMEIIAGLGVIKLDVGETHYEWRRYDEHDRGVLFEVYETPERRYLTGYDVTGRGLQRVVENIPFGEVPKDLELNATGIDGEIRPINDLQGLLEFSRTLKAGNLLREVRYADFIPSRVQGKDLAALKTLIEVYPSDDPGMMQAVWYSLLSEEPGICNTGDFVGPNQAIDAGLGSEEAYVALNALWARLNGYKTELYDIRLVEEGTVSAEAGANYIMHATNSQTGKYWLINGISQESLEADVAVQDLVDESNKSLQTSGVQLKIVDRVSF